MRKLFIAFIIFFSFTVSAQYTYKPQGTRFLVGQERPYFGSQKVPDETGPFFKKINPSEPTQNLGEIFPQIGLNGRGLFLNFSPNGIAHICELEGTTKVVRSQDGKVYAVVCGNLLVFLEAFEGEKSPEKVSKREYVPEKSYVFEPKKSSNADERLVRVQRIDSQYINGYLANSLDFNHPDIFWVPFWEWKERYENEKTVRRLNCRTVIETSYKLL